MRLPRWLMLTIVWSLLSDRRLPKVGGDTTPNLNHAPGERWDQSRGPRCLG
jgi:hypothetical protein